MAYLSGEHGDGVAMGLSQGHKSIMYPPGHDIWPIALVNMEFEFQQRHES